MGELLAVLGGLCFAFSIVMVQKGMRKASASAGVMINLFSSNLVFAVLVVFLALAGGLPAPNLTGVLLAAGSGLAANVAGRTLYYLGVRRIGSSRASLLTLTQTFFALIWGMLWLDEVLGLASLLGMGLIVSGVYWISKERVRQDETAAALQETAVSGRDRVLKGILYALLAGLAYSLGDLLRKLGVMAIPSAVMTAAIGGLAALTVQSLIFTMQNGWQELRRLDRGTWLAFLLAGVSSGIAIITVFSALEIIPLAIVNALYSIRVWFVIVLGPLLLGREERVTALLIACTILILSGALIITLS